MSSLTDGPESDPRAAARRRSAVEAAAALRDAFRSSRRNDASPVEDAARDKRAALRAAMDAAASVQAAEMALDPATAPAALSLDLPRALLPEATPVAQAPVAESVPEAEPVPEARQMPEAPAMDAPAMDAPAAKDVIARLDAALARASVPELAIPVPRSQRSKPQISELRPAPAPLRQEPSMASAALPDPGAPKLMARPEPTAPGAPRRQEPTPEAAAPDLHADQARPATATRRFYRGAFGAGLSGLGAMLTSPRSAGKRHDPSPSRWRYRLDRLSRRASVKFVLRRLSVPLALLAVGAWLWTQQAVWVWGDQQIAQLRDAIAARPEFAVTGLAISGGSPRLRTLAHEEIALKAPMSSLALDLDALRKRIEVLPGIASARLTVGPDGILRAALTERVPVALWRWEGQLHLVDHEGVVIGPVAGRADRPALPLIIGVGADRAVPEALALHARARPLQDRLRALVRVGERRWTLALDRDQAIMLPARGAEAALARVLALDTADDLLAREVTVIDMRLPQRPTLRMTDRAVAELLRLRAVVAGEDA